MHVKIILFDKGPSEAFGLNTKEWVTFTDRLVDWWMQLVHWLRHVTWSAMNAFVVIRYNVDVSQGEQNGTLATEGKWETGIISGGRAHGRRST